MYISQMMRPQFALRNVMFFGAKNMNRIYENSGNFIKSV